MFARALFVVTCLAACSTSAAKEPKPTGRVVALAELPPEYSGLLASYARGGPEWERAREEALRDPKLTSFLIENLTLELVQAHRAMGGEEFERAQRAYLRAKSELVALGARSVPTLVALLEVADPVSAAVASRTLEELGRESVEPAAGLLAAPKPETRRRAAELLARLPHAGSTVEPRVRAQMIERFEGEPDWAARTELARALGARGSRDSDVVPWRNALQAGLLDPDPLVAEASAEGLIALGDERAVPVLIDVLERSSKSGDLARFRASQRALVALTRQSEKTSIAEWRRWWAARKP